MKTKLYSFLLILSNYAHSEMTPHWDARLYAENSTMLQEQEAMRALEHFKISSVDNVLDIGCGDGKITAYIATEKTKNGKVVGIDSSPSMIRYAKENHKNIENIKFSVMDATNVKPASKFDKIVSFFCIQWVPNKKKAFEKIFESLSPGGQSCLIMTNRNVFLKQTREHFINSEKWGKYLKNFNDPSVVIDDENYVKYAKETGFKILQIEERVRHVSFNNQENLEKFIEMVSPIIKKVPKGKKRNLFKKEFVSYYQSLLKEYEGDKNYISYKIISLVVEK